VVFDSIILSLAVNQLLSGEPLSIDDLAQVMKAKNTIDDLAREVRL